jgi:septum formation protein
MKQFARIILASQSKSRAQVLAGAGLRFETKPVDLDERTIRLQLLAENRPATEIAAALASEKARLVASAHPDYLVIGADQILECQGEILEKPGDMAGAATQLKALRGKTHHLHSAISVYKSGVEDWSFVQSAQMTMHDFDDEFLAGYLDNAEPGIVGCVGSYQLEGVGARLFDRIEGDYFTVLGLPLLALLSYLRTITAID